MSLILSAIAIIVSVLAWQKSRVIYEVVIEVDRDNGKKLNEMLKTGKYTILHVSYDPLNANRTVYTLGKIIK